MDIVWERWFIQSVSDHCLKLIRIITEKTDSKRVHYSQGVEERKNVLPKRLYIRHTVQRSSKGRAETNNHDNHYVQLIL